MKAGILIGGSLLTFGLVMILAFGFRFDPNTIESPLIGQAAPDFELVDLDGQTFKLSEIEGKPVVVNFWASWCQPCAAEHDLFRQAEQIYGDRAVFIGVIYQDTPEGIRRFNARRGHWGRTLVDPELATAIAFGVYGVPETFFISPEGIVVEKVTGQLFASKLQSTLEPML